VEVDVLLPSGPQLMWVECANGSYHSVARPVLVVEDEAMAEVSWAISEEEFLHNPLSLGD
jgi:hypothetical protein